MEDLTKYDLLGLLQLESEVKSRIFMLECNRQDPVIENKEEIEDELNRLGDVLFMVRSGINNRTQ